MSERRHNPLIDEWVIVSPGRVERPWLGDTAAAQSAAAAAWEADCYLCPRNRRTSGAQNPDYSGVFVFDNDFPALDAAPPADPGSVLLQREHVTGRCRVICYSPHHDRALATLTVGEVEAVVATWCQESAQLGRDHAWVQIFENRGRMMGASNEHPHGQIWASSHMPSLPAREDHTQRQYQDIHGSRLLLDYAATELAAGERVVLQNRDWLVVVPFWAAWPFETMLLPRCACAGLDELNPGRTASLAEVLKGLLAAYDRLFATPFPYSMGWHGRTGRLGGHWQLHAHFYPPLLRSASVRKYMVGYEMLAEVQRDVTAEEAAARLRACVLAGD
jgi:UDPglucose--hexose-1-phosphate uridylyltransferase